MSKDLFFLERDPCQKAPCCYQYECQLPLLFKPAMGNVAFKVNFALNNLYFCEVLVNWVYFKKIFRPVDTFAMQESYLSFEYTS